jgi:beta-lactam-binding protein with PASTA domain
MADIHADSLIASRYRLGARLDAGGRAEVWRAVDEELKRPVAVKILVTPEGGDPAFLDRFRDEAQVEARLKHPNVVEVFDWGHDGDVNYIVMELLTGRTFRQMLDAEGPVPWEKTLSVGRQAAAALAYAHHEGTVHGNLNLHTIMVAADGHATVIAFGLWCRENCENPSAPDADAFALGGVIYEALTGSSPFGAPPAEAPKDHPWPAPPSKLVSDVPDEFDRIVMKAIAPEPPERYQTAAELQADLDALAAPKRHTGLWIALATLLLLLIAAGIVYAVTQQRVTVPDVVGKSSAEASSTLAASGLKTVVTGNVVSSGVAQGSVVSQDPAAGAQARKGAEVGIVLSTGLPMITVPTVTGLDFPTASSQIASAGLIVGKVTRKASDTFPANTVISQSPAAGVDVTQGAPVNLVVSSGQVSVALPDVRGSSQQTATTKLQNLGLKVSVGMVVSNQPVGSVVSMAPGPGTVVPAGSTVTIAVSKGTTVPNVVNALEGDAKSALVAAGFVPRTVDTSGTTANDGRVIAQDPSAGDQAANGSQVTITVVKNQ